MSGAASDGQEVIVAPRIAGVYTAIGGFTARSITLNNAPVEFTNANSNHWREMLSGAGIRSAEISGSGVFVNDAGIKMMLAAVIDGTLKDMQFELPGVIRFTGWWSITSCDLQTSHDTADSYNFAASSSGAITREQL